MRIGRGRDDRSVGRVQGLPRRPLRSAAGRPLPPLSSPRVDVSDDDLHPRRLAGDESAVELPDPAGAQ